LISLLNEIMYVIYVFISLLNEQTIE